MGLTRYRIALSVGSILLVGLLGGFLYGAYAEIFDPSFVSAVATSVLVLITGGYAVLTQRLVHETKKAREQEVVPIFILEFQAWFIGSYGVQIKNIGNGPAQNFEAELSLEPNGPKETITYQNIASGDTIPVPRPFDETDIVRDTAEEYDILRIDGKCNDIYNNEKPVSDTYVLDQMGEKVRRESYVKEDRPEDHLEDLTDELGDGFEDVEEELHEISSEVKDLNTKLRRLLRY